MTFYEELTFWNIYIQTSRLIKQRCKNIVSIGDKRGEIYILFSYKSSIEDLVFMRTKLLKWYSFSPHFTQKASLEPGGTRQSSALRLVWKNPKGFLILPKFRGSSLAISIFDHFYIVHFHSALSKRALSLAMWGPSENLDWHFQEGSLKAVAVSPVFILFDMNNLYLYHFHP